MAQGTGIQALARAGQRLGEPVYLEAARSALKLFSLAPPVGVRVTTPVGARYLLYSFAPSQIVVNALGPDARRRCTTTPDHARRRSERLFRAGDRQARLDVPPATPAPGRCTSSARPPSRTSPTTSC